MPAMFTAKMLQKFLDTHGAIGEKKLPRRAEINHYLRCLGTNAPHENKATKN
jgi:hypothetical protein